MRFHNVEFLSFKKFRENVFRNIDFTQFLQKKLVLVEGKLLEFPQCAFKIFIAKTERRKYDFFIFIWLIGIFSFQHDLLVDLYVKIGLDVILKKFKITRDSVTHI